MKKTLLLLTMSLLLCVAMMFSVMAVAESDIGAYIRFDSQATIDAHTGSTQIDIAYDAEKGALRYDTRYPGVNSQYGYSDPNLWIYLAETIDVAEYPYMRLTYTIDATQESCTAVSAYAFLNVNGGGSAMTYDSLGTLSVNDQWNRKVYSWENECGESYTLSHVRIDIPNTVYEDESTEDATVWVYDIGFFKTLEAAHAYNNNQTNYVLDMTDESLVSQITVSDGVFEYEPDLDSVYFTHAAKESDADARANLAIDPVDRFNIADLPYYSVKTLTNVPSEDAYLINTVMNTSNAETFWLGNDGSGAQYAIGGTEFDGEDANWSIKAIELLPIEAGGTKTNAIVKHTWDPINTSSATGEELVAYKYIAYYATEAEANLESQAAPGGLAGIMPTAVDGKGIIIGVDDTMEYRVTGNANEYTAVPAGATSIAVDAGKTYDVRYAAREGYNAGYAAEVGVPAYWNLTINGLKGIEGVEADPTDMNNWTVTIPYGTKVNAVELDYTLTTGNVKSFSAYRIVSGALSTSNLSRNANLYVKPGSEDTAVAGTLDLSASLGKTVEFAAAEAGALYEVINVTFQYSESGLSDDETVAAVIEELTSKEITAKDFAGVIGEDDAYDVIAEKSDAITTLENYGAEGDIIITDFVAPIAGTADNKQGTPGSITFYYDIAFGEANAHSDVISIDLVADPFRVLYMFNDQAMADKIYVNSTADLVVTDNGKIPVVLDEDGHYYAHFEFKNDVTAPDLYYALGTEISKDALTAGNYATLVDADKYPIIVYGYKRSGSYTGNHIYFQTDYYVENNTYDGPSNIDSATSENTTGSFVGYSWARDKGFYSANATAFPLSETLIDAVIDGNGSSTGITYASNGYSKVGDVVNFKAPNIRFPWTGNLTYIRANLTKGINMAKGDTLDLAYIAFFPSMTAYEEWDGSVADAVTAPEKAATDAVAVEALNGADAGSEADAKAAVEAAVAEALATYEFDEVRINTVSYTAYDLGANAAGEYKFTITVLSGDTLGDRDIYTTATKTVAVNVPSITINDAVEAVEAIDFATAGIYNEAGAKLIAEEALASVKNVYAGYTFTVNTVSFTAPTADAAGEYKFTVTVNDTTTDELTMPIAYAAKPVIINFASPVVRSNVVFVADSNKVDTEDTISFTADSSYLGGGYATYAKTIPTTEFNLSFYNGVNGMPTVEDLSDYPVVLYYYKAPGNSKNQIYYYTNLLTGGHAYQDITPANSDNWHHFIYNVDPAGKSSGATGDYSWNGALNRIRFDFFRTSSTLENATLDINYIGLFASVEQAQAFIAAPYLNAEASVTDLETKYAESLATVNAITEVPAATSDDANAAVREYIAALNLDDNAYAVVKSVTGAVNGTVEDIEGTDGSIVFTVAFADDAANGYVVESKELTMPIEAVLYTAAETTGAELRAEDNGLRFKTTFAKNWMNIVKEEGNLTYGTLVIPTDMLEGELTLDTAEAANVEGVYIYANDEDEMTFTAVITGIEEKGETDRKLTARAYVKFTYNGKEEVRYFNAYESSLADVMPAAE